MRIINRHDAPITSESASIGPGGRCQPWALPNQVAVTSRAMLVARATCSVAVAPIERSAAVVLDTNVVLDWLLFRDPRVAALAAALGSGRLRWVACMRMREEFSRTLARAELGPWKPERDRLLDRFDQQAQMLPDPTPAPRPLRCDDADDQVFVDLALSSGARWLLSRDKALLRLQRRIPPGGPRICRPSDWVDV